MPLAAARDPSSSDSMPASTFSNVDFPVPFAPTRPTRSPGVKSQSRPPKRTLEPKCFPAEESWIMGAKRAAEFDIGRDRSALTFSVSGLGIGPGVGHQGRKSRHLSSKLGNRLAGRRNCVYLDLDAASLC